MADGAPGNPQPVPDDPVLDQLTFEQLAQLVNEVSPEVFYQRAEAFDRAAARLQDVVEQVRRQLNIVRDAWTGGGADDFDALAREVTGKVTGALQTMSTPGYGAVLRAAGDALAAHQRRMRDLQGRKAEDDSRPPAPGTPSPEENARVHNDSAKQILLDLRTAYWDIGNQLPFLSYKDTRIDSNGNGKANGNGNGDGLGGGNGNGTGNGNGDGYDRPLITNPLLLTRDGGPHARTDGGRGGLDSQGNPQHWKSDRPDRHGDGPIGYLDQTSRTAGPGQLPPESPKPVFTRPEQPWHAVPFPTPLGLLGGPGAELPDDEEPRFTPRGLQGGPGAERPDDEESRFTPLVLGKPERGRQSGLPGKEHRPGEKKRARPGTDPVEIKQTVDGPADVQPHDVNPAVPKKTGVQTTSDAPAAAPPVPVKTALVGVPEIVTSTGEAVHVTGQAPPAHTDLVQFRGTDGQPPPAHTDSVRFGGTDGPQAPPVTQTATFGAGGGGGSASGAFKPEDRGMFTPGSGETGTFQGLDPAAAPLAHAPAPKPGHVPGDPAMSQPGGMPMSPMMMGGMGGQGGQQSSRMAAMPTEPRPDAWPHGGGAPGTLGRRETKQQEPDELAEGEAKAKLAEKFAELDRLMERGK